MLPGSLFLGLVPGSAAAVGHRARSLFVDNDSGHGAQLPQIIINSSFSHNALRRGHACNQSHNQVSVEVELFLACSGSP
jgi:hypothetical protein